MLKFAFRPSSWDPANDATITYKREGHRGYSFNGVVLDSEPAIDLLRNTMSHFRGYLVYGQGVYRLQIDTTGSAVYSFDEDNIKAGSFSVHQAPISDRPNRIRVKYIDASENYIGADVLYEVQSAIIPLDVTLNEHTLSLPSLVTKEEAFRMAKTLGQQSLLGTSCEFETGQDGLAVEPGDIISVTHGAVGWVDKELRVIGTEEKPDETIKIQAIEHDDAVYEDEYT
jgi:predicted phage tail protein